jgi:DNA-binding transcriptional LysR family regulator
LAHQGVILQPTFLIGEDLAAGAPVEPMPEFKSIEIGIFAVYPTRKFVSPKVRVLIDFWASAFLSRASLGSGLTAAVALKNCRGRLSHTLEAALGE